MIEAIINGWWKVLALLAGGIITVLGVVAGVAFLIGRMKKEGVDEVQVGPVKIDFNSDDIEKGK